MKPYIHAKNSAKRHGGIPEDYQDIHDFIDSTKVAIPDVRHRAVLHNAFGCFLVERVFGHVRTNSEGRRYSPRDVAEEHIQEDLGRIPTLEECFRTMPLQNSLWLGGPTKKRVITRQQKED